MRRTGVTVLVVVPRDELDEVVVERDTGGGIEDGGSGATDEIGRDDGVLGVVEDTLELALGSFLHGSLDGLVGSTLLDTGSKVDNGDVGADEEEKSKSKIVSHRIHVECVGWREATEDNSRGDTESHTGELAVEFRDDLSDGLGGTSRRGDDVGGSATSSTPVLGRGTVNSLLGSSGSVAIR